jgi:hypothetical protein
MKEMRNRQRVLARNSKVSRPPGIRSHIQGVSEGIVNVLEGGSMDYSK